MVVPFKSRVNYDSRRRAQDGRLRAALAFGRVALLNVQGPLLAGPAFIYNFPIYASRVAFSICCASWTACLAIASMSPGARGPPNAYFAPIGPLATVAAVLN